MHWEAVQFVATIQRNLPTFFNKAAVLEIGSYVVNESVGHLFKDVTYTGVDLCAGPGVDIVGSGHEVSFPTPFDTTISCECFEHNRHFRETFTNMVKHTRDGGLCVFTCATTGRLEHGTTFSVSDQSPGTQSIGDNYYRNVSETDFDPAFLADNFDHFRFFENPSSQDLYFFGLKRSGAGKTLPAAQHLLQLERDIENLIRASGIKADMIGPEGKNGERLLAFLELTGHDPHPMILENLLPHIAGLPDVARLYHRALEDRFAHRRWTEQGLVCRGRLLWAMGREEEAYEALRQPGEGTTGHWKRHTYLGLLSRQLGRRNDAIDSLNKACNDPLCPAWPHQELVQTLAQMQQFDAALDAASTANAKHPRNAGLLFAAGCVALSSRKLDISEAFFRRALALSPQNAAACWQQLKSLYSLAQQKDMEAAADRELKRLQEG